MGFMFTGCRFYDCQTFLHVYRDFGGTLSLRDLEDLQNLGF